MADFRKKLNQNEMAQAQQYPGPAQVARPGLFERPMSAPANVPVQKGDGRLPPGLTPAAAPQTPLEDLENEYKKDPSQVTGGNPDNFESFINKWKKVPTEMSPEDKELFEGKLKDIQTRQLEARQLYNDKKTRSAWAELAERLGQAVVLMAAAHSAAKNDWNLAPGIKFDKTDWEARYDRALREYDSDRDALSKEAQVVQSGLDKQENKAYRSGADLRNVLERDFFTTQARIAAENKAAAKDAAKEGKDAATMERQAKEKAKSYIANYEAAEDAINKLESGDLDEKGQEQARQQLVDAMRRNGHLNVSKQVNEKEQAKKGGIFGFFQSQDYGPLRNYINVNKKAGIKGVYDSYKVPVPDDIKAALGKQPSKPAPKPGDVVDGHRFNGGDPADQNNWSPVE